MPWPLDPSPTIAEVVLSRVSPLAETASLSGETLDNTTSETDRHGLSGQGMDSSLDKKSQIVGWLVTHCGKWCVYTRKMLCQNFRIVENKLGEGSAYLVYNGIYNGKNLQKPKIFILGTKTYLYELICQPHIEEDQTKPVCFMKKSVWSGKIWLIWDFLFYPLQWSSIVMAKILNLILIIFFWIKLIFFIKQTGLVWSSSLCGRHMSSYKWGLVPEMKNLGFWRFFPL